VIYALGLDLSLACTGIATATGDLASIRPKAGASDPARRLNEIVDRLDPHLRATNLEVAVIEGYNPRGRQGFTMARIAELGGVVRMRLWQLDVPYVEVPPAVLKKFATGSGNADKAAMVAAAVAAGASPANPDQADAFWLRQMALAAAGAPHDDDQEVLVARLDWPKGVRS
jgi:Holliday junction resolvasome RuvABC endonuclease subunit